ncbi:hypothetical protein G6L32_08035 [Agrobacterium tumefaciens]|uniref:hypothetical protein n=1 Tax=Agrobacterium tumefaciens TaxID=358 RepID=UPI0015725D10|nr:hypothetical protein [Agrobacterium tumefaciens]
MTDIISIDPVDFAGAIGHLAANGLYAILEGRELENENWFGGDIAQSEHDVYILAEYVSRTEASGERLWRFAAIEALTDDGHYDDVALSRRLAFNLFASTSLQALRELKVVQAALAQILAVAEYKEPPALKIEDSIFEQHGSLGDQEAYQAQWLKDQQAADRRALDDVKAAEEAAAPADAISLGAPIQTETEDQNRPATLSVGQQEGTTDEKEAADQGQEAGGDAQPDPDAQGSISELLGDGDSAEGSDEPVGEDSAATEVAEALADQGSDEGSQSADTAGAEQAAMVDGATLGDAAGGQEPGGDRIQSGDAGAGSDGNDGAAAANSGDDAAGADVKTPARARKSKKTKSPN